MFAWNRGWYWGEIEMTYCDADILQCSVTGEKEPECDSFYWGETEIPTSSPGNSSHNHHHHHPHHDHHHPPDHPPLPPLQQPGADWLLQVHRQAHDVSVPGLSIVGSLSGNNAWRIQHFYYTSLMSFECRKIHQLWYFPNLLISGIVIFRRCK